MRALRLYGTASDVYSWHNNYLEQGKYSGKSGGEMPSREAELPMNGAAPGIGASTLVQTHAVFYSPLSSVG